MAGLAVVDRDLPATPELPTFAAEDERKRLTGAAVTAVVRLVAAWGCANAEGAALLGSRPAPGPGSRRGAGTARSARTS